MPTAQPASLVRDKVGVNTRSLYFDTPYGDFDHWYPKLKDLGVRWVRDSLPSSPQSWVDPHYAQMMGDGFKGLMGVPAAWWPYWMEKATNSDLLGALAPYAPGGTRVSFLGAIEGPNEPDLHGGTWKADTKDAQARLKAIVKAAGITVPIIGPAVSSGTERQNYGLEPNAERGNIHPYPGNDPQASRFPVEIDWTRGMYPDPMKFWVTETGWHTATSGGMDLAQSAWKIPQVVLDCLVRPEIERVFLHELVNTYNNGPADAESNFGLLDSLFNPKPAYNGLKWLMNAIGYGGVVRDFNYGLSGSQQLLVNADDGFRILVWRPTGNVGIMFAPAATEVRVQQPNQPDIVLGKQGGAFPLTDQIGVIKIST